MERYRKADGAALRRLREDAWLSQQELAEEANVHVVTVHKIETGKELSPRMHTLIALAKALRVHPDALVEPPEPKDGNGARPNNPFEVRQLDHYRNPQGARWDLGYLGHPQGEQAAFGDR